MSMAAGCSFFFSSSKFDDPLDNECNKMNHRLCFHSDGWNKRCAGFFPPVLVLMAERTVHSGGGKGKQARVDKGWSEEGK